MFDTIFDLATITLLAVTIAYTWKLNRRLATLTNSKGEIASNLRNFSEATETAVVAVEELHVKGEGVCTLIDQKIRKAQEVADEIELLTRRADKKLAEVKNIRPGEVNGQPTQKNQLSESEILAALRNRDLRSVMVS